MNNFECLSITENLVQLQNIDIFGFLSQKSSLQRPTKCCPLPCQCIWSLVTLYCTHQSIGYGKQTVSMYTTVNA